MSRWTLIQKRMARVASALLAICLTSRFLSSILPSLTTMPTISSPHRVCFSQLLPHLHPHRDRILDQDNRLALSDHVNSGGDGRATLSFVNSSSLASHEASPHMSLSSQSPMSVFQFSPIGMLHRAPCTFCVGPTHARASWYGLNGCLHVWPMRLSGSTEGCAWGGQARILTLILFWYSSHLCEKQYHGHVADLPTSHWTAFHRIFFGAVSCKKVCEREIRGPGGASFVLRNHVPTRVSKFSRENHVDSLNWTTDSGQQWIASADCFDGVVGERCDARCRTPL
jgi:hypothetical protein